MRKFLFMSVMRCFAAAAVLFGAPVSVLSQSAEPLPPPGYKDVRFGPTVYRVPYEKYHIGIQPYNPERDHAAMIFSLILPDLAPSTSDPAEAATWGTGGGFHKQLSIQVEYGENYISQEKMLKNAFDDSLSIKQAQDKDESEGKTVHRFKYLDSNTFLLLPNGCKQYEGYIIGGSMIEVCRHGDSILTILCNIEKELPSGWKHFPYCQVHFNYADKTQLTYSFGYEYLDKMPEIHMKLIDLLNSFRLEQSK